ncbi:MAG: Outer membrane protein TolC [Candidatus Ordinivivax streblomastigis]|uniref:Outer membrane protein TolC n=1 Tax=Candidatus Ordinivivax streblomastigis TaxID=2540710 RepID=A0A5M8NVU3_9BACT|nr:MAG: Outer membrane protein TolC [Candidatus Ordinivivax streblomastigis]
MKKTLFLLLITVSAITVKGEEYTLTLEQSIAIAKEKSYTMRKLVQDLKIAEYHLKSASSSLKTHIDMNWTLPSYKQGVQQDANHSGIFFPVKQLSYSTGLTISQPLLTDGSIFVQSGLNSIHDYYDDSQAANLNTQIGFKQPLNAFYGYNAIKTALKNAELGYERANKVLKRNELMLITQVSNAYYTLLLSQKSAEIAKLNLERQTDAYDISKKKYEAGLIREVDALQMEVDLAEAQSNYDMEVLNQSSALNSFKELIGIQLNDGVTLSSELLYKIIVIDPERAVKLALENRSEIREQEISVELLKLDLKRQQANGMVRANLEAFFGKEGIQPLTPNAGLFESISNASNNFGNRSYNYGIGFTVAIPLFDWGENRALVRAAQARIQQSELDRESSQRSIETEVRNLVASIGTSLKRLQLLEKNVAVAEKSFEITLQRFSDGDIDSQSLALERARLNTAHTSHLSAYISYQMALTNLMRATFYDFQNEVAVQ